MLNARKTPASSPPVAGKPFDITRSVGVPANLGLQAFGTSGESSRSPSDSVTQVYAMVAVTTPRSTSARRRIKDAGDTCYFLVTYLYNTRTGNIVAILSVLYDLAAIAAVLAFREANAWPYGAAHLDDPRTMFGVRNLNGRAYVTIHDFKTWYSKDAFNCSGDEFYRVDLQNFDVKPYDGCYEGAPPKRVLPSLRALPD